MCLLIDTHVPTNLLDSIGMILGKKDKT